MKKSALALAIGAAFAAPAMAQTTAGNVTIYGKVYPQLGYYKSSGASVGADVTSNLVAPPTAAQAVSISAFGMKCPKRTCKWAMPLFWSSRTAIYFTE